MPNFKPQHKIVLAKFQKAAIKFYDFMCSIRSSTFNWLFFPKGWSNNGVAAVNKKMAECGT